MTTRAQRHREILANRLRDLGIVCDPDTIDVPRGYWSHAHQDVMRWTVYVTLPHRPEEVQLGSWDSIARCARRDVHLHVSTPDKSISGGYEIHAIKGGVATWTRS